MEGKTALEWCKLIMNPVRNDDGKIIAASFPYEDGEVVKCEATMSNVKQHLASSYYGMLTREDKTRWNPRKRRKVESNSTQPTIEEVVGPALSRDDCAEILARGCAMGALPLSLAQNPGIRYICRKFNPRSIMTSRSTVTRHVDKLFSGVIEKIGSEMRSLRKSEFGLVNVAVCLDTWTSLSASAHLGMNAFILDNDFVFHRYALACVPFPHPHTAVRIAEEAAKVLARWGMSPDELIAVTTDNEASARKLAGTEAEAVKKVLPLRSIAAVTQ